MRILIVIIIVLAQLLSINIQAQNKTGKFDFSHVRHSIGAAAGFSTGYGLAYIASYKKVKTQFTFFPYHYEEQDYQGWGLYVLNSYSSGFTFFYVLDSSRYVSFFAYQGNHWYYDERKYYRPYIDNFTIHGLGLGFDVTPVKAFSLHIMGGYAWYGDYGNINFTVETGLFYNF